jgi:hypothetical protein
MFLEEAIEILRPDVTKKRSDSTDLGGRKGAQQPTGSCQSGLDLTLGHGLLIFGSEDPLKRSFFHSELPGNDLQAQSYMTMNGKYQVMHEAGRSVHKLGGKGRSGVGFDRADLGDDRGLDH